MSDIFKDIIGYEDVKRELRVISDMMNNPEIYKKMGASMEKALSCMGSPVRGRQPWLIS